jgi:hypothetical protein
MNDPKNNYDWMSKTKINTSLKCDHNFNTWMIEKWKWKV